MAKQKKAAASPAGAGDASRQTQPAGDKNPLNKDWHEKTWLVWPVFALATVLFYWTPLFEEQATIQWDMVDVHYSAQKYFEQSVRTTGLPTWTPFEYSGIPFLADPQTAAWYPLHWPFFLIGISPRSLEWEMALHAFLALGGMYLLARKLTGHMKCSVLAGILYAWSGFFTGHSSHLGMFETAALAPWLLWAALVAIESGKARAMVVTGGIGGLIVLAGHFQTALYSFFALGSFVIAVTIASEDRGSSSKRAIALLVVTVVLAFLIAAIQVLPGLELAARSIRAGADFHTGTNSPLHLGALATLFKPNFYGVISGDYEGPADITQFYLYGGLLLIPLAACAAWGRRRNLLIPLALIVPALWYALGPGTGLYSILTLLPGFSSVRAPVHIWFVVALGLALAAAFGSVWLEERFRRPWLVLALIVFSAGDLWYWNMASNPLAYGRSSFAALYGDAFANYQSHLAGIKAQPLYRIWSPFASRSFGPLNSALESRTEVTYGYSPLELTRYAEYMRAADSNPKLLDGLAVTNKIDAERGAIVKNPNALPRVSVPPQVTFASSPEAARAALTSLDPAQSSIVEGPARALSSPPPGSPAVPARVQVLNYEDNFYRIRYSARGESLLRIAVPYFPGWTAAVDGRPVDVVPADYALSGVIVPAGDHELMFRYRSTWFRLGAILSALAVAAAAAAFAGFSGFPSIFR